MDHHTVRCLAEGYREVIRANNEADHAPPTYSEYVQATALLERAAVPAASAPLAGDECKFDYGEALDLLEELLSLTAGFRGSMTPEEDKRWAIISTKAADLRDDADTHRREPGRPGTLLPADGPTLQVSEDGEELEVVSSGAPAEAAADTTLRALVALYVIADDYVPLMLEVDQVRWQELSERAVLAIPRLVDSVVIEDDTPSLIDRRAEWVPMILASMPGSPADVAKRLDDFRRLVELYDTLDNHTLFYKPEADEADALLTRAKAYFSL